MPDLATLVIAVDSTDVKSADRALQNLGSTADWLEGMFKKMMAALATYKIAEFIKESATLAARYETLGVVMGVVGNNAGYTRAQMEGFAQSLQQTGISMIESRNSLSVMAQAHIDLSKATQLGRIAQDAAVIGNINSSEAFQRMIYGIQSGQTEILRTIGLNVNFENSYKELSKQLKKNVLDLTEEEKTMARTNAVMAKGKDVAGAYAASMETAGKQLLSMKRYAEDTQVVFGSIFGEATGVIVQGLNQALQDTKKWLDENATAAATMNAMLGNASRSFVETAKSVADLAVDLARVDDELTTGEILAGGLALAMAVVRDIVVSYMGYLRVLWGSISEAIFGTLNAAAKLLNMLTGWQPPKWIEGSLNTSREMRQKGYEQLTTNSATERFFNGGDFSAEINKMAADQAKKDAEEQKRIEASRKDREKRENEAKAKQAQAAAKRARESDANVEALLLQRQIDDIWQGVTSNRNVEALVLQQQIDQIWQEYLNDQNLKTAIDMKEINDLIEESADYMAERNRLIEEGARITDRYLTTSERMGLEVARLDALYQAGGLSLEAYQRYLLELDPVMGGVLQSIEHLADAGSQAMASFINGTKTGFRDMVSSILLDLERLILKEQLVSPLLRMATDGLLGAFGMAGGAASAVSLPMGIFDLPGRANGGPVYSGTSYLVGERGPEIFTPGRSGSITPNSALGGTVNSTVIVNVDSNGNAQVQTQAGAGDLGEVVQAAAVRAIQNEMRPGGLLQGVGR